MSKIKSIIVAYAAVAYLVSSSTITGWTDYDGDLAPYDWNFHRGFYSDNKIYLVGHIQTAPYPMVFDLETQTWSAYTQLALTDSSMDGQYGTAINGVYYWKEYSGIARFDPSVSSPEYTDPFAGDDGLGWHLCLTNNGQDSVYILGGQSTSFKKLDISTATLEDGPPLPYSVSMASCAVYKGVIYAFGGNGVKISKIDVGENNENFATANWVELGVTMPESGMQGEAVLAANDIIYIGAFTTQYATNVWSFDPNTEAAPIAEPDFSKSRDLGAFVFSEYDNRLYALSGRNQKDVEYSNVLQAVDLCENCPANKVCDASNGECTRDCTAFQIDEFLDDCSNRYDTNVAGIGSLDTSVAAIETRVGTAETNIGTINTNIGTIQGTLIQVRTDITSNDDEITGINTELTGVQTSLSALQGIDNTFESRVSTLETRMDTMDTTVSTLTTDLNTRIDSVETDFNAQIDAVNDRLDLYTAKSVSVGHVINDKESYVYEWLSKDTLIILLLMMNMSIIIGTAAVCVSRNNKAKRKIVEYENVNVCSSADESQRLKN